MNTVREILDFFEEFAPVGTAMDFDNCGLLVGNPDIEISRVLVSLDITSEVIREAEEKGCELIISHHPVIFSPLKRLSGSDPAYLLAKSGIAAVCMHTNLDLSEKFGVNTCLADAVGIRNVRLAEGGECLFIGELENKVTAAEFARGVKTALGCEGLRFTDPGKMIKTVAVSSGSGGSNVLDAAALGADALVVGEIKHHEINAANALGLCVVDAGHFKSEDVVILPLVNKLSEKFPAVEFSKSESYSDGVRFL